MDYQPKVSVIIPVYNVEKYLKECLDSVINQTLKEIEIICIDDGSTDNSLKILQEYATKDKRITIIINKKHTNAGYARNCGLHIAKGKYLSFIDSDDFVETNMLEDLYQHSEDTFCDICVLGANRYDIVSKKYSPIHWGIPLNLLPEDKKYFSAEDIKEVLYKFSYTWVWNKFFRTSFIRQNEIYFQEIDRTNDLYFAYLASSLAQRITYLPNRYYNYRVGQISNLQSTNWQTPIDWYKAHKKLFNKLKDLEIYDKFEYTFINSFFDSYSYNSHSISDKKIKDDLRKFVQANYEKDFQFNDEAIKSCANTNSYQYFINNNDKNFSSSVSIIYSIKLFNLPIIQLKKHLSKTSYCILGIPFVQVKTKNNGLRKKIKLLGIPLLKIKTTVDKKISRYYLLNILIFKISK